MSEKVDALFAGVDPQLDTEATPRIARTRRLLSIAIVLDILGLPCWTSVPGSVLTLWVWMSTDTDLARIQAGEFSDKDAAELMRLRRYATIALALCVVSLLLQIALLSTNFYTRFWGSISVAINHLWHGV